MKEIKLIIDKNGNFTLEHKGIKGTGCTTETEKILRDVAQKKSDRKTPEYYEKETVRNTR